MATTGVGAITTCVGLAGMAAAGDWAVGLALPAAAEPVPAVSTTALLVSAKFARQERSLRNHRWVDQDALVAIDIVLAIERRGGRVGGGPAMLAMR